MCCIKIVGFVDSWPGGQGARGGGVGEAGDGVRGGPENMGAGQKNIVFLFKESGEGRG